MTQEDKELLLKDISSRLPYGVKMNHIANSDNEPTTLIGIVKNMITLEGNGGYSTVNIDEFKPYLFPLSSMTDEQRKELEELYLGYYVTCQDIDDDGYIWDENVFEIFPCTETDDWCNKNHFDYRGLIPKGIALDATGKNVY